LRKRGASVPTNDASCYEERMFGASPNELALVVLLVLVVLAAPKVPRLGERIGAFFDKKPR
jgi:hypothetical protein